MVDVALPPKNILLSQKKRWPSHQNSCVGLEIRWWKKVEPISFVSSMSLQVLHWCSACDTPTFAFISSVWINFENRTVSYRRAVCLWFVCECWGACVSWFLFLSNLSLLLSLCALRFNEQKFVCFLLCRSWAARNGGSDRATLTHVYWHDYQLFHFTPSFLSVFLFPMRS